MSTCFRFVSLLLCCVVLGCSAVECGGGGWEGSATGREARRFKKEFVAVRLVGMQRATGSDGGSDAGRKAESDGCTNEVDCLQILVSLADGTVCYWGTGRELYSMFWKVIRSRLKKLPVSLHLSVYCQFVSSTACRTDRYLFYLLILLAFFFDASCIRAFPGKCRRQY